MIEDAELRGLFKAESAEHVHNLERCLLILEADPHETVALEEAFRDAHSIKGSARMVGVKDVELVSRGIEAMLGAVRSGKQEFTSASADRIYRALDCVKKLVEESVTGEASGVNVPDVLRLLENAADGEARPRKEAPQAPEVIEGPRKEAAGRPPSKEEDGAAFHIDTIRVETRRLDELVTLSGEFIVMKTRMGVRLRLIDECCGLMEATARRPSAGAMDVIKKTLDAARNEINEVSSKFGLLANELDEAVRRLRLVPFSAIFNALPRMARDLAREGGKEIDFKIDGGDTLADKRVIEEMKDPLIHLIRNAVDHGIETPEKRVKAGKLSAGTIAVKARRTEAGIVVEVGDDGNGLDINGIKKAALKQKILSTAEAEKLTASNIESLVFSPGFSTSPFVTDISGRGVGLDVVRANVEALKGTVETESAEGQGLTVRIRLPITLAAARVLIARENHVHYGFPVEAVAASVLATHRDIFSIEGRHAILFERTPISAVWLADILGTGAGGKNSAARKNDGWRFPCVILQSGVERFGVIAEELIDEEEVVLKPGNAVLKRVRNVSGMAILANGEICIVLNPNDMLKSLKRQTTAPVPAKPEAKDTKRTSVLLVEDSITTRTQEKRILEAAGYDVITAVNGVDALSRLAVRGFDAVVSDILMPEMDGLTLTTRIRQEKKYMDLPVILVTTLASDEDKKRGLEAGANAYIPKPSFDQKLLLDALKRLV